jgi:hypothetical protein
MPGSGCEGQQAPSATHTHTHCVPARYTGPAGSIGSSTNYVTAANSDLKYGWTHEQCGAAYQGICQIPSYSFVCPVR